MKRLSKDMARQLNSLGCKSTELANVIHWLIDQGYFLSVSIFRAKDYIGDGKYHLYYHPSISPVVRDDIDTPLTSISPFMAVKDHYMEAVEMGLQWVIDNKLDCGKLIS